MPSRLFQSSWPWADGKFIFLDEDGKLALLRLSESGMQALSQHQLFNQRCWTIPTLIGSTLYVRNRQRMVALDVGE